MLRLNVTVADVADVLTAYDTLRLYSAATETGVFALLLSTPLVSGQTAYSFLDPAGTAATWYRTTYYQSFTTAESAPGPAFSVAGAASAVEPGRPHYITPRHYARQATGNETATLLGALANLPSAAIVGATSLVVDQPGSFSANILVTISDGANTENVLCLGVGSTALTVTPLQFAHAAGTCVSAPGSLGSVADTLADASAWIDNYCQRSFYGGTITETAALIVDVEGRIALRPRNPPATALSALSVTLADGTALNVDLSQSIAQIAPGGRSVAVLPFVSGSGLLPPLGPYLSRTAVGQVTYTYQGGYSSIPADVVRACVELTSDLLANRYNPSGAAELVIGKRRTVTRLRGDMSGESILVKRALGLLDAYRRKF